MSARPHADEDAWFEELFHSTRADVLAYLTRRTGPGQAAEAADLLAEVYLVAWRRRDDLPKGRERLWLFGAARRLLAQHHRHQAGTQRLHQDLARQRPQPIEDLYRWSGSRPVDGGSSPASAIVRDALDELSDLDQELITLTAWEQLSTADAARVVGITATSARVRLHRARRRLAADPSLLRLLGENSPDTAGKRTLQAITDHG